jgi:RecA/RadA recombinase
MPIETDLQVVLSKLNEELKDPSLFSQGSQVNWSNVTTWIPTGSTLLDIAMTSYDKDGLPVGSGWACGRWYEVFGEEGMGKTTLIENGFAQTQKMGGITGLIDSESKFYKPRAERIGIDLERLILNDAPYVEKGIECFTSLMEAFQKKPSLRGIPIMYAWDTIASAPTKREYEEGQYSGGMAEKARITRQMYRDLTSKLPGFNCCFILVNQVSDTMGGPYAKQTDTTGGRGAKYHASARLELHRFGVYNDPDNAELPQGIMVRIKLVKSSLFKPFAEVELPFNFESGIDDNLSLVNFHTNQTKLFTNKSGLYRSEYFLGNQTGSDKPGKRLRELLVMIREDELLQDLMKSKARDFGGLLWRKAASYATPKEKE